MRKVILLVCSLLLFHIFTLCCQASPLIPNDDNIVIVIDPGHGGENLGTDSNAEFNEKDINLITANALIEELSKYPGITVYSTRTEDVDLSLKERAVFAKKVNADFLFSLHYNASEKHTIFGAEVWIPLKAPYHASAYQFAYLQLQEMEDMGLFIRGIKTRANDNGNDYYGMIRECVARDIPAVIIEHCHVDEIRDSEFCSSEEMFKEFGRRDARAIATFLNLDNSFEQKLPVELQKLTADDTISTTFNDYEAPDVCTIDVVNADYESGILSVAVNAVDNSNHIQYYDYSIDGGRTYSIRYPWPDCDGLNGVSEPNIVIDIEIPENTVPKVIVRAYNKFDLLSDSNMLSAFETFRPTPSDNSDVERFVEMYFNSEAYVTTESTEIVSTSTNEPILNRILNPKRFLLLFGFSIIWIITLILGTRVIKKIFKKV